MAFISGFICIYSYFPSSVTVVRQIKSAAVHDKSLWRRHSPVVEALGAERRRAGLRAALRVAVALVLHRGRWTGLDAHCTEEEEEEEEEEKEKEEEIDEVEEEIDKKKKRKKK